jgi:hypothetical protein
MGGIDLGISIGCILMVFGSCRDQGDPSENKPAQPGFVTPQSFSYSLPGQGIQKILYNNCGHYLVVQDALSPLKRIPGLRSVSILNIKGEPSRLIQPADESEKIIDATLDSENVFIVSLKYLSESRDQIVVRKTEVNLQLVEQVSLGEEEKDLLHGFASDYRWES